jgi:hypothetical protein
MQLTIDGADSHRIAAGDLSGWRRVRAERSPMNAPSSKRLSEVMKSLGKYVGIDDRDIATTCVMFGAKQNLAQAMVELGDKLG